MNFVSYLIVASQLANTGINFLIELTSSMPALCQASQSTASNEAVIAGLSETRRLTGKWF